MTSATPFSALNWMAVCGHTPTQMWQPQHFSGSMYEIVGSTLTVGLSTRASAHAAAAPACATVSGMSLGYWQQPAMKMPSVTVLTGSSLG